MIDLHRFKTIEAASRTGRHLLEAILETESLLVEVQRGDKRCYLRTAGRKEVPVPQLDAEQVLTNRIEQLKADLEDELLFGLDTRQLDDLKDLGIYIPDVD